MKSKNFLIALMTSILFSDSLFAVENSAIHVENSFVESAEKYQIELICEAVANDKVYLINLAWGRTYTHLPDGRAPLVRSNIYYKILEKESGIKMEDSYTNSFREFVEINENASNIELKGGYHLYKRIGQIQKDAIIKIKKIESNFELAFVHLSHYEDWGGHLVTPCDQPFSKLCNGDFPQKNSDLKLEFNSSNCSIVKSKN